MESAPPQRLLEYFVTVGLRDELIPLDTPYDEISTPITDISIISGKDKVPPEYEKIDSTMCGQSANLNTRKWASGNGNYLCVTRSGTAEPVTDVVFICPDQQEGPPPGYTRIPVNLNRYTDGQELYMCYTKGFHHPPIIEISFVSESDGERCPAGFEKVARNINDGCTFTKPLHLCLFRAPETALDISYQPVVLDRFPVYDHSDSPLRKAVTMFCMPEGLRLSKDIPLPTFLTFVLTSANGLQIYGCSLTFYESADADLIRARSRNLSGSAKNSPCYVPLFETPPNRIFAPKAICLLSHWPFFEAFKSYLTELYRISVSPSHIPIERYLSNLWEAPLPRTSRIDVELSIGDKRVVFDRPAEDDFPLINFKMETLFSCLSLQTVTTLVGAMLSERKVIIHSSHLSLLTPVAEALRALLFPFQWNFTYIPVLPCTIFGILDAPMPILVGMHSSHVRRRLLTRDGIIVCDLDNDCLLIPQHAEVPPFPSDLCSQLRSEMQEFARIDSLRRFTPETMNSIDVAFPMHNMEDIDGLDDDFEESERSSTRAGFCVRSCRAAFIHFFVTLLGHNYDNFFTFPALSDSVRMSMPNLFDKARYVNSRPRSYRKFLKVFVETQAFTQFVEEKTFSAYTSQREDELKYWDRCCAYETKLLESDKSIRGLHAPFLVSYLSERRFESEVYRVPLPVTKNLKENQMFTYPTFPALEHRLFTTPRPLDYRYLHSNGQAIHKSLPEQLSSRAFDEAFMRTERVFRVESTVGHSPPSFDSREEWSYHLLKSIYACWLQMQVILIDFHPNPSLVFDAVFDCLWRLLDENQAQKDAHAASSHRHRNLSDGGSLMNMSMSTLTSLGGRGAKGSSSAAAGFLAPDELMYRAVLVVCGKHRRKAEALQVFETMKRQSVKPSSITYNAYAAAIADGPVKTNKAPAIAAPWRGSFMRPPSFANTSLSRNISMVPIIEEEESPTASASRSKQPAGRFKISSPSAHMAPHSHSHSRSLSSQVLNRDGAKLSSSSTSPKKLRRTCSLDISSFSSSNLPPLGSGASGDSRSLPSPLNRTHTTSRATRPIMMSPSSQKLVASSTARRESPRRSQSDSDLQARVDSPSPQPAADRASSTLPTFVSYESSIQSGANASPPEQPQLENASSSQANTTSSPPKGANHRALSEPFTERNVREHAAAATAQGEEASPPPPAAAFGRRSESVPAASANGAVRRHHHHKVSSLSNNAPRMGGRGFSPPLGSTPASPAGYLTNSPPQDATREARSYSINSFVSEDSFTLETEKAAAEQKAASNETPPAAAAASTATATAADDSSPSRRSPARGRKDKKAASSSSSPSLSPTPPAPAAGAAANAKQTPTPTPQHLKAHSNVQRSATSALADRPPHIHTNHRRWSSVMSEGPVESSANASSLSSNSFSRSSLESASTLTRLSLPHIAKSNLSPSSDGALSPTVLSLTAAERAKSLPTALTSPLSTGALSLRPHHSTSPRLAKSRSVHLRSASSATAASSSEEKLSRAVLADSRHRKASSLTSPTSTSSSRARASRLKKALLSPGLPRPKRLLKLARRNSKNKDAARRKSSDMSDGGSVASPSSNGKTSLFKRSRSMVSSPSTSSRATPSAASRGTLTPPLPSRVNNLASPDSSTKGPLISSHSRTSSMCGDTSDDQPVDRVEWSELYMTTVNQCPSCHTRLLDAHVMAGWGEDSHKYTTVCHACKQREFVPNIRVRYRTLPPEEQGEDSSDSDSDGDGDGDAAGDRQKTPPKANLVNGDAPTAHGAAASDAEVKSESGEGEGSGSPESPRKGDATPPPRERVLSPMVLSSPKPNASPAKAGEFTELECPYLSPLVLRKEVETAVSSFSADLTSPDRFRLKHATIYWNLMWYLHHLDLPLDILVGDADAREGIEVHRLVYYAIAHESKGKQARVPRLGDVAEDLAIMTESFKKGDLRGAIAYWLKRRRATPRDDKINSVWSGSIFMGLEDLGAASYFGMTRADFIDAYTDAIDKLSDREIQLLINFDRPPNKTVIAFQEAFSHPRTFGDLRV